MYASVCEHAPVSGGTHKVRRGYWILYPAGFLIELHHLPRGGAGHSELGPPIIRNQENNPQTCP